MRRLKSMCRARAVVILVASAGLSGCAARDHSRTPADTSDTSAPVAVSARAFDHEGASIDRTYIIRYSSRPTTIPLNHTFEIDFAIFNADGPPAVGVAAHVDAAMPHHGHGMNTAPIVVRNADGTFTARGMLFHMSGAWELYFDATRAGMTERAKFDVEIE